MEHHEFIPWASTRKKKRTDEKKKEEKDENYRVEKRPETG